MFSLFYFFFSEFSSADLEKSLNNPKMAMINPKKTKLIEAKIKARYVRKANLIPFDLFKKNL